MTHRYDTSRGFTLIELVAGLVIVGILAAIAVPRFSDATPFRERGYNDEVASALRYAQRVAIASGCPVRITFVAGAYSARQQPLTAGGVCNSAGAWNVNVRRADGTTLAGSPPDGVVLTPADATLTFDATTGGVGADAAFTTGANFAVFVDGVIGTVTTQP